MQADIKTISALGCYACTAITAITVQSTSTGVRSTTMVEDGLVEAQVSAVIEDLHPKAVKIGMLGCGDIVRAVSRGLDTAHGKELPPVVLDPVLVSTSGRELLDASGVGELVARLFPKTDILTPNIPETEFLTDVELTQERDFDHAARVLIEMGCKRVLIKGGHGEGRTKIDRFYDKNGLKECFTALYVPSRNTHGTGCTLSSAIAAYLARGEQPLEAVRLAKTYITDAIIAAKDIEIGNPQGRGPLNHFFNPQSMILCEKT